MVDPILRFMATWGVPIMMGGVYLVLAITSNASTTAKAWMAIGFAFVVVIWTLVRFFMKQAGLTRALSVGDTARVLELTARDARSTNAAIRTRALINQAVAHDHAGDPAATLAALANVEITSLSPAQRSVYATLAGSARIGATLASGATAEARRLLDTVIVPASAALDPRMHPTAHLHVALSIGRIVAAEGNTADARLTLQSVIDDIRATPALREMAKRAQPR